MIIELYADVLCGWAYVGKRRLAEALALIGDDDVRVRWRPFLIDPSAPRPSEPLDVAADGPGIEAAIAAGLGIGPGWAPRWRANSWAAHRLIRAAEDRGPEVQDEVAEALLHAHFVTGADLGRLDVLAPVAARFDLPAPVAADGGAHALAYLEPGTDRADPVERATREALLTGKAIGVGTSPSYVVADTVVATGAQSAATLAAQITAALAAPPTAPPPEEVRRLRHAEALLAARDPLGCLYLLEPLRPAYDGERSLETLTARALVDSASLGHARAKLAVLLEHHPDDGYLHLLMSKALRRSGDEEAAQRHLALARALDP